MSQHSPPKSRPKRQHYVPQLLLRYFCAQGSDRLWAFDKETGKVWQQAIHQIGHEKYFNDASLGNGWSVSYEHKFQYIESKFAPVLAKLNGGAPIKSLSAMEFALLCYFVAVQYLRTPAFLSENKQLNDSIRRLFPDGEIPETFQKQVGPLTDDAAKQQSLYLVFELADAICRTLVVKAWILHEAHPNRCFYISDTPVALHNNVKDEFQSTVGFSVPGIEIYMPISATTLVGAYCPILAKSVAEIEPFRTTLKTGARIPCDLDNMDFYNSLQVANAERFVYCRDDDFEFAKKVLQQHPELRKPRRLGSNIPVDGPA